MQSARKDSYLLKDLLKIKDFLQKEMGDFSSQMTLFYQKANPFEKVLRYNVRHSFILFTNLYKGELPQLNITDTTAILGIANGAFQLIDGALLLGSQSLHATRDKLMGVSKILSGASGIALSYTPWISQLGIAGLTSATALAGPAFALTRLVDLTCSAINFHYAYKETNLTGWLEERYKEIDTLNKKINYHDSKEGNADLILKRREIEEDIRARLFCAGDQTKAIKFSDKKLNNFHHEYCDSLKKVTPEIEKKYQDRNNEIEKKIKTNVDEKGKDLVVKSLAFSGALLLAVAPFSGPAAPALFAIGLAISIGVGLYSGAKLAKDKHVLELFTEMGDKLKTSLKNKFKTSDEVELRSVLSKS